MDRPELEEKDKGGKMERVKQYMAYRPLSDYCAVADYEKQEWFGEFKTGAEELKREKEQFEKDLSGHKLADYYTLDEYLKLIGCKDSKDADELAEKWPSLTLYDEFQRRLLNYNAIETGQIEGQYNLNKGVTEMMIATSLLASKLSHGDLAGQDGERIELQLQDQRRVTEGLFSLVKKQQSMNLSDIRGIHSELCAHQDNVWATDPEGNRGTVPLQKGQWKEEPNNPKRPDGSLFHYCSPGDVQAEMQYLCDQIGDSMPVEDPGKVILLATYLHHRFTLVHPFQDGNGRVARVLASSILIRGNFYPLMVTRGFNRTRYLDALEVADEESSEEEIGSQPTGTPHSMQRLCRFILEMQKETLEFGRKFLIEFFAEPKNKAARDKIWLRQEMRRREFLQTKWNSHGELEELLKRLCPITVEKYNNFFKSEGLVFTYKLGVLSVVLQVEYKNKQFSYVISLEPHKDTESYTVSLSRDKEHLDKKISWTLDDIKSGVANLDDLFNKVAGDITGIQI